MTFVNEKLIYQNSTKEVNIDVPFPKFILDMPDEGQAVDVLIMAQWWENGEKMMLV